VVVHASSAETAGAADGYATLGLNFIEGSDTNSKQKANEELFHVLVLF